MSTPDRLLNLLAYERLSRKKEEQEDHEAALRRQHNDNEHTASANGGRVAKHYCDPAKSAWRLTAIRPEYERLLIDLPSSDGLVAYNADRVARRELDAERLIRVFELNPHLKCFFLPDEDDGDDGFCDLSTARGRDEFRAKIRAARKSADDTSRRVKRWHKGRRDDGIAHRSRHRPFGISDDRSHLVESEADILRGWCTEVISGVPVGTLSRRAQRDGIPTLTGGRWNRTTVLGMLKHPRMAGFRVHQGLIVRDIDGNPVAATHPAIVPVATWQAVCDALKESAKQGRGAPGAGRKYMLSGVLRCATCNLSMHGRQGGGSYHVYSCPGCLISIHGPKTEATVEAMLRDRWAAAPAVSADAAPFLGADELARLQAKNEDLMDRVNNDEVTYETVAKTIAKNEARIASLKREHRAAIRADGRAKASVDPWAQWMAASDDLNERRLLILRDLECFRVKPNGDRQKRFNPDRLVPVWR